VRYAERPSAVPGAVIWTKAGDPGPSRILPDGCIDLIWDGAQLFVAGPDSVARWHTGRNGTQYTAVRFADGLGPVVLGVPASAIRDRTPGVADIWPAGAARDLAEQAAADPLGALERWLRRRVQDVEIDSFGPAAFALASGGCSASEMAERLGVGARQLHRRCLTLFGYGPRHLVRVLRMSLALDHARAGSPLAEVAALSGYADQAHLTREVRELAGITPGRLVRELAG
jgi:AraC-like DNA-binding protein